MKRFFSIIDLLTLGVTWSFVLSELGAKLLVINFALGTPLFRMAGGLVGKADDWVLDELLVRLADVVPASTVGIQLGTFAVYNADNGACGANPFAIDISTELSVIPWIRFVRTSFVHVIIIVHKVVGK